MAATVEIALCARLKAVGALDAVIDGRVYPQLTTQEPTFPQLVYQKVGAEPTARLKTGSGGLKAYTVRIDCYAETEIEAGALGQLVRDALTPDGTPWRDLSAGVLGCFHVDSTQDFTEDGLRFQGETFTVWFKPT